MNKRLFLTALFFLIGGAPTLGLTPDVPSYGKIVTDESLYAHEFKLLLGGYRNGTRINMARHPNWGHNL